MKKELARNNGIYLIPNDVTHTTCISPLAEIRFLNGVLQQRIQKVIYEDGLPVDSELSWKDVPNIET